MRSLPARPAPQVLHRQADDRSTAKTPKTTGSVVSKSQAACRPPDILTVVGVADCADGGCDPLELEVLGEADRGVLAAGDASLCVKGFWPVLPVVMLCRCSARSSLVDHCWLPPDVDRTCAPAGWLVMDEPASCEVWDRAAC